MLAIYRVSRESLLKRGLVLIEPGSHPVGAIQEQKRRGFAEDAHDLLYISRVVQSMVLLIPQEPRDLGGSQATKDHRRPERGEYAPSEAWLSYRLRAQPVDATPPSHCSTGFRTPGSYGPIVEVVRRFVEEGSRTS